MGIVANAIKTDPSHVSNLLNNQTTEKVKKRLSRATEKGARVVNQVVSHHQTFLQGLKLANLGLSVANYAKGVNVLPQLAAKVSATFNVIDTLSVFDPINFFVNGQYKAIKSKTERVAAITQNSTFVAAGTGGFFLFLSQLKIINIAQTALKILGQAVLGLAALAYTLKGVLSGIKIVNAKKVIQKKSQKIEEYAKGKIKKNSNYYDKKIQAANKEIFDLKAKKKIDGRKIEKKYRKIDLWNKYKKTLEEKVNSETEDKLENKEQTKVKNDSFEKLKIRFHQVKLNNAKRKKSHSILNLIHGVAEVTVKIFMIIGALSFVGFVAFTGTAALVGLVSSLINSSPKDAVAEVLKYKVEG